MPSNLDVERPCRSTVAIEAFPAHALAGRLVSALLAVILVASFSSGAQTAWSAENGPDTVRGYDIAPGELAQTLNQFAQQADITLSFTPEQVEGKQSAGLQGSYSVGQALQRLLTGSGLGAIHGEGNGYVLQAMPEASGEVVLPTVMVEGVATGGSTYLSGQLPPVYAGGQVARGGGLGILGNKDMMDTPFNQTSYTSKLIEDQQAQSLGEVVQNDPSVIVRYPQDSGEEQFTIRGFGHYSGAVSFDGLFGVAPSLFLLTPETLERIEVLKGPNALLSGIHPGASLGGTINVIPKKAGDEPITRFVADYSSNSQLGGHLDMGRRIGGEKQFGVRFNGVYRNGETAIDDLSRETQVASLGLDFQGKSIRLSSDLGYQNQSFDSPRTPLLILAGAAVPDAPDGSSNYAQPWDSREQQAWYGTLRGEADLLDYLTAFAAVGGSTTEFKGQWISWSVADAQGTLSGAGSFSIGYTSYENDATVEVGLRGQGTTGFLRHDFVLSGTRFQAESGVEAQVGFGFADSNLYNPIVIPNPNFDLGDMGDGPKTAENENTGFALADTLSALDERIQLMLGVRWQQVVVENFDGTTGALTSRYDEDAWSPGVGFVVKPWENVSIYGNYIQGLEPGGTAPSTAVNAGEIFPPYKTEQYESGLKVDMGRFATTLSVFQIARPSAFTDPATNVFAENGEQRNRGVELGVFGELARDVRVLGGITFLDAVLTKTRNGVNEGNRPSGAPEIQATLTGEWDTAFLPGLTLSGSMVHMSSSYVDSANTQEIPDWTRLDLGARYTIEKLAREPIVIRGTVRNIADTDYWATSRNYIAVGEPRSLRVSVTLNF